MSDTEFYCNDSPAELRFLADEKGNAGQIAVKIGAMALTATRLAASQKPGL